MSIASSGTWNLLSMKRAIGVGVMLLNAVPIELPQRTKLRATFDEPNISSPSFLRDSPTSVSVTLRAFFEVAKANTMMAPAAAKK